MSTRRLGTRLKEMGSLPNVCLMLVSNGDPTRSRTTFQAADVDGGERGRHG